MAVQIIWDDETKTVLRQIFTGRWTTDELLHGSEKTYKLLTGLNHTVHIIFDLAESEKVPSNILSVLRDIDSKTADNQGLVVAVGMTPFLQTVITAAQKIAPRATANWCAADTLEEARHIIEEEMGLLQVV